MAFAGACAREAPGPAECEAFALRWAEYEAASRFGGVVPPGQQLGIRRSELESVINACLTVPFDRKTLRCAQEGRSPRSCVRALEARREQEGST